MGEECRQNVNNYTFLVIKLCHSATIGLQDLVWSLPAWIYVELCLRTFFRFFFFNHAREFLLCVEYHHEEF